MVQGKQEKKDHFPMIITCPNEVSKDNSRTKTRPDVKTPFSDGGTIHG
jgi:hypothetical protein